MTTATPRVVCAIMARISHRAVAGASWTREDRCWCHRNPRLAPDKPADLARADEFRKFLLHTRSPFQQPPLLAEAPGADDVSSEVERLSRRPREPVRRRPGVGGRARATDVYQTWFLFRRHDLVARLASKRSSTPRMSSVRATPAILTTSSGRRGCPSSLLRLRLLWTPRFRVDNRRAAHLHEPGQCRTAQAGLHAR